ncbi:hypothetical protein [Microcella alkaliphila]|uniref:Uncharacterized protein n=1 Tax=Microcella alkaliphila TaxID=279828 RepID=A0A0U5B9G1_9MICO|nr:hypothetical protein [Microcella alkaliphila]BAU32473.1 predicted protein [Microcella alkaliphila]
MSTPFIERRKREGIESGDGTPDYTRSDPDEGESADSSNGDDRG